MLLGPALEVEVVQGADGLPEIRLVGVAHVRGVPTQGLAHDSAMREVERVFVVTLEKLERLLRSGNHGLSFVLLGQPGGDGCCQVGVFLWAAGAHRLRGARNHRTALA